MKLCQKIRPNPTITRKNAGKEDRTETVNVNIKDFTLSTLSSSDKIIDQQSPQEVSGV